MSDKKNRALRGFFMPEETELIGTKSSRRLLQATY